MGDSVNSWHSFLDCMVDKLLSMVWLPKVQSSASNKVQAKSQVIGLTKFVCDLSAKLLSDSEGQKVFAQVVLAVVSVLASPTFLKEAKELPDETPVVYDATFSQLKYAQQLPDEPFNAIADPVEFFVGSLNSLNSSGVIVPLIQQGLGGDPKLTTIFQTMCQSKGVNLV